ncbi:hypothetical protein [Derxia gummosa]|uniref:Uncharacterized protein n=1 Tax=Derxia gummosa DSM 723 TaxID=1121388 RepID=A0A8B6X3G0_9BURK|nr:hypothetical protein [Derxia gummosa]
MTGESVAHIPRRRPDEDEFSFEQLLEAGVALVQRLSGKVWTDFNAHDPGLTLLEALCFALTDVVYRADFPLPDHLADDDGRLDPDRLALPPAARAYPCRPLTVDDWRRLLLDRVPALDDARPLPFARATTGAVADLPGLWTVALRIGGSEAERAAARAEARAVWQAHRNLGEDLHAVETMRPQVCDLDTRLPDGRPGIEIGGGRDAIDIAIDIYVACARYIADRPRRQSHDALLAEGRSTEDVFGGPPLVNGVLSLDEHDSDVAGHVLFVGELRAHIAAIDGVREVLGFALRVPGCALSDGEPVDDEGMATVTGSVLWHGEDWALQLRQPDAPDFERHFRLALRRAGQPVRLDLDALRRRFADLRQMRLARGGDLTPLAPRHFELPRGIHRDLARHDSVALDLPEIYGVGPLGVPATVGLEADIEAADGLVAARASRDRREARAAQLRDYLALFDRTLADGLGRLARARELFSLDDEGLLDADMPAGAAEVAPVAGAVAATSAPPMTVAAGGAAFAAGSPAARLDRARRLDHKHRALDHLLALQGERHPQDMLRQFLGHLEPARQDERLLANKLDFLRAVLEDARDRGAGFDHGRPSWRRSDNHAPLARRLALLLGFEWSGSRPLATEVMHWRAHFARMAPDAAPAGGEGMRLLARLLGGRADLLDDALLGAACHERNFSLRARNDGQTLLLALDEAGTAPRELGRFDSAAEAWRAARALRGLALHLARRAEGLHLVEHLLLRPLGRTDFHRRALGTDDGAAFDAALADFCAARVSLVLPAWGPRCGDPLFRHHLADLVREHAPAHLLVEPVWLDSATLGAFETDYEKWLADRVALAAADPASGPDDDLLRRHDRHAARLARLLRQAGARP